MQACCVNVKEIVRRLITLGDPKCKLDADGTLWP